MFRKITSNRDPGKTLDSELKKEFGIYFERAGKSSRQLMEKYPRQIFSLMIVAILFSGVLAFTVMREQQKPMLKAKASVQNTASGIGQIISTANTMQALWATQQQVDLLLKKDTLTHADSLTLDRALIQMESLRGLIKKSRPNY
jgi:preprotein translocase subunit YajC